MNPIKEVIQEGFNSKKERLNTYRNETRPARHKKAKTWLWYALPTLAFVMFVRVAFFLPAQPEVMAAETVKEIAVEPIAISLQPDSGGVECNLEKSKVPSEIYRKCSLITEESSKYGIPPVFLAAILVNKNQGNEISEIKIHRIAQEVSALYDQFNGNKTKLLESYLPNNVESIMADYKSYK